MRPRLFKEGSTPLQLRSDVVRVEVPMESANGTYMVMLLDADDSFDVVVEYPDGQREAVWSLCKP